MLCYIYLLAMETGKSAVTDDNLHDSDEASDNQPHRRRVETCDIDAIESDAIRGLAHEWEDLGREIEAGRHEAGDYLYDIHTGVAVFECDGEYIAADGCGYASTLEGGARVAARTADEYLDSARCDNGLPPTIEDYIDMLDERGFGITHSMTSEDTPSVFAGRGETRIEIAFTPDHQWWVSARNPRMSVLSEMYDRPQRAVSDVERWLDELKD